MILYNVEAGIARITLNRPEKRNALNPELIETLDESLARSAQDETVHVVLISGAGPDFCSGADLSALDQSAEQGVMEHLQAANVLADIFLKIRRHPRPVVAAVRGKALAGGCGLAAACDLVLANKSAQFGFPEVKIGFVPAMVMAILRRSVNEKRAFELATTGEIISASEAQIAGLVNHVYDDDNFEARVAAFAEALASQSASAIALTKRLLYQMDGMTFQAALDTGVQGNALARMTDDARRGIERFAKKL